MVAAFHITHIEPTAAFVLYHLDAPKQGHTAIVAFRGGHEELAPTLATLHRRRSAFDFEIDPAPLPAHDDPRLRAACRIRSLTLLPGA